MDDVHLSHGTMPPLLGPTGVLTSRFLAPAFAAAVLFGCGGPDPPRPTILPPPPPSPPGVPQNLMVTDRGDDFIRWQWDRVSGAAGYQVQVSVGDDDFDPPDEEAVLPANETAAEFRDPELAPGTVVHLRVRAFAGSAGSPVYGPFSPAVPGMTSGAPPSSAATDRMAVEAFFHATGGPDWSDNTAWLSSAPLSEWLGVWTDADGRVTALILDDNGLRGTIPPELGQLTELRRLILGEVESDVTPLPSPFPRPPIPKNRLDGTIPPALGELTNLEVLDLSSTGVSGTIPVELGQVASLVRLDLAHNALSGPIPAELGGAANLVELHLGHNRLSGPIPAELGQLIALEYLGLGGNELSGSIPPELGRLKDLRSLHLQGNPLMSGPIPLELTDLTPDWFGLSLPDNVCVPWGAPFDLWVDRFRILGEVRCPGARPAALRVEDRAVLEAFYRTTNGDHWRANSGWLSSTPGEPWHGVYTDVHGNVVGVRLSNNRLAGRIPAEVGSLTKLTVLELPGNSLNGSIPMELGQLANLEALDLGENHLSGAIPPELGGLTNLTQLGLGRNRLTGSIPMELGQLARLDELDLRENQLSGAIPPELGQLVSLEALRLEGNQLSGAIPSELGLLMNLENLHLAANRLSGQIPSALGALTRLRRLTLHDNPALTGPLPDTFLSLDLWGELTINNTGLCVPATPAFDSWLARTNHAGITRCPP